MNSNLLFDFSVNKENKTIHVKREFDAGLDLVWQAWTTAELLDQWWAPKPFRNQTKTMDFRNGGFWHYAMIGPENETHWAKLDYQEINEQESFSGIDGFCDENANINPDLPRSQWKNTFSETADKTTVDISITFNNLTDLEKTIEMGFKEGFTAGLQNLDTLLINLKKES